MASNVSWWVKYVVLCLLSLLCNLIRAEAANPPVRIAIVGLVHGHVWGFIPLLQARPEVQLVGIVETDQELAARYAKRFNLPRHLFFTNLDELLARTNVEAVAAFTTTYDHPAVVEACAKRNVHVIMMEKPLAVDMAAARRIHRVAQESGIQVVVNYETTWYRNHAALWQLIKQQAACGEIRKMVALDGHNGPEKYVGPEFYDWLFDPVKNGDGALFDFGCYGANLMTWLMDNRRPLAVTGVTQTFRPQINPKVDDDATIIVEYPRAMGFIEASWNWPFNRKDLEVYGEKGYVVATAYEKGLAPGESLEARLPGMAQEEPQGVGDLPEMERDSISYLVAVARGKLKPAGLSSLENNLIVTEILDAARQSAHTGERVVLPPNPPW
jgi:predicted dehydrogenase